MKYTILSLLLFISNFVGAQIKVPKNFYLIKGESPVGRDDYYTDGQYILSEDTPFQAEHPSTDEEIMILLTKLYGVSFNKKVMVFIAEQGTTTSCLNM